MNQVNDTRSGIGLGTRIFLATALLIVIAVAVAVAATLWLGNQVAQRACRATLERAASAQGTVRALEADSLPLLTSYMASDPSFAAYVADAIESGDRLSILDQLEERQADVGYDFAIVLDDSGQLFASTAPQDASASTDFATDPLVQAAIDDYEGNGVRLHRDELYQAVAVPIATADLLAGYLIAAFALDENSALELRDIGEADVVFFRRDGERLIPTAGTLDDDRTAALETVIQGRVDAALSTEAPLDLELAGAPWLALARPLLDAGDEPVGTVISLASPGPALAPYRRLATILTGVGLAAILLGLLPAFVLTRRVLRPIDRLVSAARAAAEGDYDQQVVAERPDEIGVLASTFDGLLAELREKRDMERYINQLSRTLPDPTAATARTSSGTSSAAPTRAEAIVVGLELRAGHTADTDSTTERLARHTEPIRRTADAVRTHGGSLAAVGGHRVLATFSGGHRAARALAAVAAVADAGLGEGGPAIALASGEILRGAAAWSDNPADTVTGAAVADVERLLRVAKPNDLLVDRSLFAEVRELAAAAQLEPAALEAFDPALPIAAVDGALAQRLVGHQLQATWATATGPSIHAATTTTIAPAPGAVVGGRFEILSELGQGGMGVVYKAHDRELDELVAVKMIRTGTGGVDAEQLERLKMELKLARRITHPNIVRTFDFGEVAGMPFITMEYIHGITLRRLIDTSGALPLSAGLRLARQLCRGLGVAHGEGVLHRDIKPENLIVEPTGNAKLMDFGIARTLVRDDRSSQTQDGSVIGTPYYLAPEQLRGQTVDARADLYACGVVFYEIFTGELPFLTEGGLMQVLTRKLEDELIPARDRWPGIPENLETIIARCLRSAAIDRYEDVEALLQDLESCRA